jgi:choline dehydrogenase-like flavoprotein
MDHSYIPRFNADDKKRGYAGGFGYQLQDSPFITPYQAHQLKGFGKSFKEQVRFLQPGFIAMDCFGKVLARRENRVTVDPDHKDAYGIPISVINFRFGDNDKALWRDMKSKAKEILDTSKVRLLIDTNPEPTGFASHEAGTLRMGNDPRTSVVNKFCQAHDVDNLFVVDGSCFVTFPEKNPTHTIMALAVRTAEHIVEQIKRREL